VLQLSVSVVSEDGLHVASRRPQFEQQCTVFLAPLDIARGRKHSKQNMIKKAASTLPRVSLKVIFVADIQILQRWIETPKVVN